MSVLVTGGTGFIGSITSSLLIENGFDVVIVDNLSNSKIEVLERIKKITNVLPKFYQIDLLDLNSLEKVFQENKIDSVIHFAGLKAVGDSVNFPVHYYDNNIVSTLNLLKLMEKNNCSKIVFSSSATVYGKVNPNPISENGDLAPESPYGKSKLFIEEIIKDYALASNASFVILRYFNPIGAHESGILGEDPNGVPNNLVPYISRTLLNVFDHVRIFGNDYNTKDGTGERDYIHVQDLALGHLLALRKLEKETGIFTYNLGTGRPSSVLEIINAFEKAANTKIKYQFYPRRKGDIDTFFADPTKAEKELGFKTNKTLNDMCIDELRWLKNEVKNS